MQMRKSSRAVGALCAALLTLGLCAQELPPANFSGAIRAVSKKRITIETAEGNLLEFDITSKTRVMRGKTKIEPESLKEGEAVKIEAKQEPSRRQQFLEALTITAATPQ
jgi:hypothetical protein